MNNLEYNPDGLKKLYIPPMTSHKGQNGKLLIIGGSRLFHAASLWALEIASKIVDMVYYSSVVENNEIVFQLKKEFHNGIVVRREDLESYIEEADCVLIGPGLVRQDKVSSSKYQVLREIKNLRELQKIEDEGLQTRLLTEYLLKKYRHKKWVIDAGSLQEMEVSWIPPHSILTPHQREFEKIFNNHPPAGGSAINEFSKSQLPITSYKLQEKMQTVQEKAKAHNCVILLKGVEDIICSPAECKVIKGGNAGMTKGGTGDVLAGLTAALYCKNEAFLSACAASFFNKKAGESLFQKVGYYFNASDLVNEIPKIMKEYLENIAA